VNWTILARWEDDGGPPVPDPPTYTHTIRPFEPAPCQRDHLERLLRGERMTATSPRYQGKRAALDMIAAATIDSGQSVRIVGLSPEFEEAARQRALALLDERDRLRAAW
jgi:hypothetical protein